MLNSAKASTVKDASYIESHLLNIMDCKNKLPTLRAQWYIRRNVFSSICKEIQRAIIMKKLQCYVIVRVFHCQIDYKNKLKKGTTCLNFFPNVIVISSM